MASSTAFDTALANMGIKRSSNGVPISDAKSSTTLGQADFLKLMTAQMQNQDPFEPVDNTQMIAQMAQFSSVAGISEMNTTLQAISKKLTGTSTADAVSYLGTSVLIPGKVAYARTSGGIAGGIELAGDASDVTLTISGADGSVLKTLPLGKVSKGEVKFEWDGKLADGKDAGPGPFTVTATARNNGAPVEAQPLVWSPVQSVTIRDGVAMLTLPGLGQVSADTVREVG